MVLRRLRRMGTLQEQVQQSREKENWDRGELEELGEAVMLVCPRPVMLPAAYFLTGLNTFIVFIPIGWVTHFLEVHRSPVGVPHTVVFICASTISTLCSLANYLTTSQLPCHHPPREALRVWR